MKKKKAIWFILILSLCLFISGSWVFFNYVESEKLDRFPVPKNLNVIDSGEDFESYELKREAVICGMPTSYRFYIKVSGWEKVSQMGTLSTYQKGNEKVDVICQHDHISIFKESMKEMAE
ncbi:hypothetical protein LC087_00990 [Bacillus carboniphilus]|uniref:Lipoprotein n=1 Tax=Bacillus carboniphilus TaxID=86663 RepID=A0ABY9JTX7_9BACI|nr:hypothetical protein [Bacillus carboniphilus]WLR42849.1 hypothetical protein LC087_00990 [Bacillus carboniphilus]